MRVAIYQNDSEWSRFGILRCSLRAVGFVRELFERAENTCRNAQTLTVDANRLQVHILATLARDVGVAAGMAKDSAFSRELADARHNGRDKECPEFTRKPNFWQGELWKPSESGRSAYLQAH